MVAQRRGEGVPRLAGDGAAMHAEEGPGGSPATADGVRYDMTGSLLSSTARCRQSQGSSFGVAAAFHRPPAAFHACFRRRSGRRQAEQRRAVVPGDAPRDRAAAGRRASAAPAASAPRSRPSAELTQVSEPTTKRSGISSIRPATASSAGRRLRSGRAGRRARRAASDGAAAAPAPARPARRRCRCGPRSGASSAHARTACRSPRRRRGRAPTRFRSCASCIRRRAVGPSALALS